MNRWTYVIQEVSAGCYEIEAIRDTHHSIQRKGFEDAFYEILRESFEMEITLGTILGDAAFHVTKGFKSNWSSNYYKEAYGSWLIYDPKTKSRIEYDAKEFWITMMHDPTKDHPAYWSGRLPDLRKPDTDYFRKLTYLY